MIEHNLKIYQLFLDDDLEVAQSFVARVENRRQKPSVDLILKFSYIFNVPADILMKDELELGA